MSSRLYFCLSSTAPLFIPLILLILRTILNWGESNPSIDTVIVSGAFIVIPYTLIWFFVFFILKPKSASHFARINVALVILFTSALYYCAKDLPMLGIILAAFGLLFSALYSLAVWSVYALLVDLLYIKNEND